MNLPKGNVLKSVLVRRCPILCQRIGVPAPPPPKWAVMRNSMMAVPYTWSVELCITGNPLGGQLPLTDPAEVYVRALAALEHGRSHIFVHIANGLPRTGKHISDSYEEKLQVFAFGDMAVTVAAFCLRNPAVIKALSGSCFSLHNRALFTSGASANLDIGTEELELATLDGAHCGERTWHMIKEADQPDSVIEPWSRWGDFDAARREALGAWVTTVSPSATEKECMPYELDFCYAFTQLLRRFAPHAHPDGAQWLYDHLAWLALEYPRSTAVYIYGVFLPSAPYWDPMYSAVAGHYWVFRALAQRPFAHFFSIYPGFEKVAVARAKDPETADSIRALAALAAAPL